MLTNSPKTKRSSSKKSKKVKDDVNLTVDTVSQLASDPLTDSPSHLPTPPPSKSPRATVNSGGNTPKSARKVKGSRTGKDAAELLASPTANAAHSVGTDEAAHPIDTPHTKRAHERKSKEKSSEPVQRRTGDSSNVALLQAALHDSNGEHNQHHKKSKQQEDSTEKDSSAAQAAPPKSSKSSKTKGNTDDEVPTMTTAACKNRNNINSSSSDSNSDTESDISSDEDGDFAAITAGVVDPEKYQALRHYFLKYRQQEKTIAQTVKEVDQLASKQRQLLQKAHQKQRELDRSNVRIKNHPSPPHTPSTLKKSGAHRSFNTVSRTSDGGGGDENGAISSSCDAAASKQHENIDAEFKQLTSNALKSFITRKETKVSRPPLNGVSVGLDDSLNSSLASIETEMGVDEDAIEGHSAGLRRVNEADDDDGDDDGREKSKPFRSLTLNENDFPMNQEFQTTQAPGMSGMRAVAAQLRNELDNDTETARQHNSSVAPNIAVKTVKSSRNLRKEVIDGAVDEFEDLNLKTDRCVPFRQDYRSEALNYEKESRKPSVHSHNFSEQMRKDTFAEDKHLYRTGAPSIKGEVSAVFDNGMLYKIVTEDGAWAFFNDTEQYEMQVRFIFGASSKISKGPRVVDRTIRGGRHEYKLQVKPSQTEVLLAVGSSVNGYRNLSVANPLPISFQSRNTKMSRESVNKELLRIMESSASLSEAPSRAQQDEMAALGVTMELKYPFIDPTFPPLAESIYRMREDLFPLPAVPWYRPEVYIANVLKHILSEEEPRTKLFSSSTVADCRLFRGRILPEDVSFDSDLSPRYLISAMAALAEYPSLVRMLFKHPVSAEDGKMERSLHAYRVNLMNDGWWKSTLLDDFFPASLRGPVYALCASDLQKLWVPLLEKGVAKARGSYSSMMSGDVLETLQELTGFPTYNFVSRWEAAQQSDLNGPESTALFLSITEFLRSRALVVLTAGVALEEMSMVLSESIPLTNVHDVSTNDTMSDTKDASPARTDDTSSTAATITTMSPVSALKSANAFFEQNGLSRGMSYAVIRVVEDPVSGIRLIKLRNPWFALPWVRGWSFDDPRWDLYPNLRDLCQVDATSYADGVWLEWNDIIRHFCGGGVLLPPRTGLSTDVRVRGVFENGVPNVVLHVKCSVPVTAYVSLSQCDQQGRWSRQSMSMGGTRNSVGSFLSNADPSSVIAPLLLCVVRNNDEIKRMYTLDMCSTSNPHEPRPKMGFVTSRDVSMRYTFDPKEASSFYIVPRVYYCNHIMKSYVLGLVVELPFDSSLSSPGTRENGKTKTTDKNNSDHPSKPPNITVSFERLSSDCGVYKNVRRFSTSSVAESEVVCDYQIRDTEGRITEHNGSSFSL